MGQTIEPNVEESITYLLQPFKPGSFIMAEYAEPQVNTPSEYFSFFYPDQAKDWGTPFLEARRSDGVKISIEPVSINVEFFAAIIGGDKRMGHDVVYLPAEDCFYFFDPSEDCFVPTTEEKLKTLLSQVFLRCAEEMGKNINIHPLFQEFREPRQLRVIIEKAKSILAVEENFFDKTTGRKRKVGRLIDPNVSMVSRRFVKERVVRQPEQILTVAAAYADFIHYCDGNGLTAMQRKEFRALISEAIREEFSIGLRHDLIEAGGRTTHGWKGLASNLQVGDALLSGFERN